MKRFNKIFTVLFALSLSFVSCDDSYDLGYDAIPDSGWVEFSSADPVEAVVGVTRYLDITVDLDSKLNNGIEVFYEIQNPSSSIDGLIVSQSELMMSSDEFTGTLTLEVNPNSTITENVTFDLVLTGTSNNNVSAGLVDGSKAITKSVSICPTQILAVGTDYAAIADTPDLDIVGDSDFAYDATLTPVEGFDNKWALDSAWGPNYVAGLTGNSSFEGRFTYPVIVVLNEDSTVSIEIEPGQPTYYTGGSGTYDGCNDTFVLNLTQDLFNGDFGVQTTLVGK